MLDRPLSFQTSVCFSSSAGKNHYVMLYSVGGILDATTVMHEPDA